MIIKSMGGEFDIKIEGFEVEGRHLVMTGRMGVWDAKPISQHQSSSEF